MSINSFIDIRSRSIAAITRVNNVEYKEIIIVQQSSTYSDRDINIKLGAFTDAHPTRCYN